MTVFLWSESANNERMNDQFKAAHICTPGFSWCGVITFFILVTLGLASLVLSMCRLDHTTLLFRSLQVCLLLAYRMNECLGVFYTFPLCSPKFDLFMLFLI